MTAATVVFHALCPDLFRQDGRVSPMATIIYDLEFEGELYSHCVASVETAFQADINAPVVKYDLPFTCHNFEQAALAYYEYVLGPHGSLLSPSGPKGLMPKDNVFRVEWEVHLDCWRP